MPTYEYACKDCGSHLEVVQSFSDDPLTECPSCSGSLRKVFGTIGIAFKGSGFYKTDSRPASTSSSKKPSEGSGGGDSGSTPAAADSSSASKGSESKPSSSPSSPADKAAG